MVGQLESQGLHLELTTDAKLLLAAKGYDPALGARPLRRAIQRMIEDPLSEALIQGDIQSPAVLEVIVSNEALYYRSVNDKLVAATPLSH